MILYLHKKIDATPKKLNYQWTFSYLTGFTGSAGFSFLFLSFRTKLRKKNPATRENKSELLLFYGVL